LILLPAPKGEGIDPKHLGERSLGETM
jgi:hypothetical protein